MHSDPVGQNGGVELTAKQRADWDRSGWLVARDAFTEAEFTAIDVASREVES